MSAKAKQYDLLTGREFVQARAEGKGPTLREKMKFLRDAAKAGGYVPVGVAADLLEIHRVTLHEHMRKGSVKCRMWRGQWFIEGYWLMEEMDRRKKAKKLS